MKTFMAKHRVLGIFMILFVLLILFVFLSPFVIVSAGHKGVILEFGRVSNTILDEGIHFRVPVYQKIKIIDVRIQKYEAESDAASKDLQQIKTKIAINYRIIPEKVGILYRTIGQNYENVIIAPFLQESVKAVVSRYTAEELITKREDVSRQIKELMGKRLLANNLQIENFNIVDFNFSVEFNKAIEAKQTAEQMALKAKRDLDRVRIEAEQKVAQAKAEAEALKVQKQEITPELIKLREVETQMKAIEKWDGKLPGVTGGTVPFIQVDKQ